MRQLPSPPALCPLFAPVRRAAVPYFGPVLPSRRLVLPSRTDVLRGSGYPRAVEPEGDPGRQVHGGHGRPTEGGGVEDDEIAGASGGVEDHAQDPALSLVVPVRGPHENRFAGLSVLPGVEALRLVPGQAVPDPPA